MTVTSSLKMVLLTLQIILVAYVHFSKAQLEKGSLIFVIDDTSSMQDDIDNVKDNVKLIFDSVMNSKDSPVQDVVLVTFNDKPEDTRFLTRTTNEAVFKNLVSVIKASGGDDCPESSFSGIKRGLEESRNGSFLYVFTDNMSDDEQYFEEVQNLAINKHTQIAFILTRHLCLNYDEIDYQKYYRLAKVTSGHIFRMEKEDVGMILNFVAEQMKTRQTEILKTKVPPGRTKVTIPIDGAMSAATLTAVGDKSVIKDVTAPDGSTPNVTTVVKLPEVEVVKIPETVPGNYTATVGSSSGTDFDAAATTTVTFKYGFSAEDSTSMEHLATMPAPAQESHIYVQIFTNDTFSPSKIIITGEAGNVIKELPLKAHNAKENIYITDKYSPEDELFKIGVFGYHEKSKTNITRVTSTFIEVQKVFDAEDRSPTMNIDMGLTTKVTYGESVKLSCQVDAYPQPEIIWKDEDGNNLKTKVLIIRLPYSYKAVLEVEKVSTNKTYKCMAENLNGEISQNIRVETERPQYIDILDPPKDTSIIFRTSKDIYCKVNAKPPATITWKKNDEVIYTNKYIGIAGDTLLIRQMMPHLVGEYKCIATNGIESKDLYFNISIIGTEPSTMITELPIINVEYNEPLIIHCNVKGYPKPEISWINEKTGDTIKSDAFALTSSSYDYGKEMLLERVNTNATYKCIAKNGHGEHSSSVTVITIRREHFDIIESPNNTTIKYQGDGQIFCKIDAYPVPSILWMFEGRIIVSNDHYEISSDRSTLKVKHMQPTLKGKYTCIAENKDVRKDLQFVLKISGIEKPKINKTIVPTDVEIKLGEGSTFDIDCRIVKGMPPPTFSWKFKPDGDELFGVMDETTSSIHFDSISRYDSGVYVCTASNVAGYDTHVVYLTVQYPPSIEETIKQIDSKDGSMTTLPCLVTGSPPPTVVWSVNDKNITKNLEYTIFRNNSLRFSASLNNNGKFTCTATNKYGTARSEIQVDYYTNVTFDLPEHTQYNKSVGERLKLECTAYGYPEPTITWEFISPESPKTSQVQRKSETSSDEYKIKIKKLSQEGVYICIASNKKTVNRLAFEVKVDEQAYIERNTDDTKPIKAIKGDLIRIPCKAKGKPKPAVTWSHEGILIPTGYDDYSLNGEGALVIANIKQSGFYTCVASNYIGSRSAVFKVEIQSHPPVTKDYATYDLEVDKPGEVVCPIPHTSLVDPLRWYRHDKIVSSRKVLKFDKFLPEDAGIYTCRVTRLTTYKSESLSVLITVK